MSPRSILIWRDNVVKHERKWKSSCGIETVRLVCRKNTVHIRRRRSVIISDYDLVMALQLTTQHYNLCVNYSAAAAAAAEEITFYFIRHQ